MTQSNRRSGSAIGRASRYSSSVSGFFISAYGNFSALARWATQNLAEILARGAVSPHVIGGQKRKARIGAAGAVRIDRIAAQTG